ncbi:MAG: hypothetical protein ACOYEV_09505 [Candidatus Nanopelagicales bacterium]
MRRDALGGLRAASIAQPFGQIRLAIAAIPVVKLIRNDRLHN